MIRYTRNSIYARCLGQFFFKFSWEETSMCRVCMLKMIAFFPRNILWSSLFVRKARVDTERVPPGHPIILLNFNKFNTAAVSVKRSISSVKRQIRLTTVEPPLRDHPKCEDLVVAYGRWSLTRIEPLGISSEIGPDTSTFWQRNYCTHLL